ncbi:hypothetical protein KJ632_04985 [Patescibacteria group bacterium]|nr:hypothetical protein [Patescibacteria group bacterium]
MANRSKNTDKLSKENTLSKNFHEYGVSCFLNGAQIGAKTYDNIVTFSGIGIGLLITFWGAVINDHSCIVNLTIVISLILFFSSVIFSIRRNNFAGHCLVAMGKKYFEASENGLYKTTSELKSFGKGVQSQFDMYDEKRKFASKISQLSFVGAILFLIVSFSLQLYMT